MTHPPPSTSEATDPTAAMKMSVVRGDAIAYAPPLARLRRRRSMKTRPTVPRPKRMMLEGSGMTVVSNSTMYPWRSAFDVFG